LSCLLTSWAHLLREKLCARPSWAFKTSFSLISKFCSVKEANVFTFNDAREVHSYASQQLDNSLVVAGSNTGLAEN
jgi:hypothetical protein